MLSSWNENFVFDSNLAIDDSQMDDSEIKRQRKISWGLRNRQGNTLDKQITSNSPDDLSRERTLRRPVKSKEVTGTTNGMTGIGSPQKCKTNEVKVPEDNCTLNVRQHTEYELRKTVYMQQKIIDYLIANNSINPLRGVNNFSDSISSLRHSPNPCGVPKNGNAKGLSEMHSQSNAKGERNKKIDYLSNHDRKYSDEILLLMSSSDDMADSSDYADVVDLEDDSFSNVSSRDVDRTSDRVNYEKKEASVEENNIREHISQVDTPMTCPNSTASFSEYADVTEAGTDVICSHGGSAEQVDARKYDLTLSRENNETRVVNAKRTAITFKNIPKKGKSEDFKYSFCAQFYILAMCNLLVILSGVSLTLVTVYRKQDLCLECKELSSLKTDLNPFIKEDGRCCLSSIQQLFEIFANVTSEAQRARTQEKQDSILAGLLHHATIPVVQCNAKRTEKFGNVTRIAWEIDSRRPAHKGFEKLGPGNNTLINIPVAGYYYLFSRVHYRTSHDAAEKFLTLGHSVILVRENLEEKIDSVEDTMHLKAKFTSHTSHLSFVHNFTEKDSLYLRLDNQKYFNKFNTIVGLFFIQKADDLKQVLSEKPAIIEEEQSDTMYRKKREMC